MGPCCAIFSVLCVVKHCLTFFYFGHCIACAALNGVGLNQDYEIGICCFSAKHTALMGKSKDWLARNQNNVSSLDDMLTRGLLFQ